MADRSTFRATTNRADPPTAPVKNEFLIRLPKEGELQTLLAFDEWLKIKPPIGPRIWWTISFPLFPSSFSETRPFAIGGA